MQSRKGGYSHKVIFLEYAIIFVLLSIAVGYIPAFKIFSLASIPAKSRKSV